MPTAPQALMLLASRTNNLTTGDIKPWHIKASFQLFDEQGSTTDEGTYEEFWASPEMSRHIFTGKAFTLTDYKTNKGEFFATSNGDKPSQLAVDSYNQLANARDDLITPMPDEQTIEHTTYSSKALKLGGLKLTCLTATGSPGAPTFCLTTNEPILRIRTEPADSSQALYNRILRFEGRTIASDLKIVRNRKAILALHIDTIESLDDVDKAAFVPPPDAVLVLHLVNLPAAVTQGMLVYRVAPEYPDAAHIAHISGTVVLQGIIGKNGRLRSLKAIAGPEALQGAAIQAVQQWRYRPYMLNGEPVEVMTTINVHFLLPE